MTPEERIVLLETRLAAAEDRIARLESGRPNNGFVPTPPFTWPLVPSVSTNPNTCGKCGLKLEPVMGYVCPQGSNCPCGLGGFSCAVADALTRNA